MAPFRQSLCVGTEVKRLHINIASDGYQVITCWSVINTKHPTIQVDELPLVETVSVHKDKKGGYLRVGVHHHQRADAELCILSLPQQHDTHQQGGSPCVASFT